MRGATTTCIIEKHVLRGAVLTYVTQGLLVPSLSTGRKGIKSKGIEGDRHTQANRSQRIKTLPQRHYLLKMTLPAALASANTPNVADTHQ